MRPRPLLFLPLVLLALLAAAAPASAAGPGATFLAGGLDLPAGAIAGGTSGYALNEADRVAVSDDGRFVAFSSDADLLDPAANPDTSNVYRKDRLTGAVVLVSRASGAAGAVSDRPSYDPTISDDGSVVAFRSRAALDPADSDGDAADVYVRNLGTGVTTLASVADGGGQTAVAVSYYDLSGDGTHVAFSTEESVDPVNDTRSTNDIYLRHLATSRTELVSRAAGSARAADGGSYEVALSDDGRWVAFASFATDLVAVYVGSDSQVFVRDLAGAVTYVASNQAGAPSTGGNGSAGSPDIAGAPSSLARVVVTYDTRATDVESGGIDADSASSVYVHRMSDPSRSQLVSVSDAGVNADSRAHTASISDDGTRVEFDSDADNLTTSPDYYGVYLRDLTSGRTLLASADTFYSVEGALSGDGSFVGWFSGHGVTPDADPDLGGVFGRPYAPPAMGTTELVSRPPGGASFLAPAIEMDTFGAGSRTVSADGRYIVFRAYTSRLPGGVPGGPGLVYRRDLATGAIELVSRANGAGGAPADGFTDMPTISADGTRVAFLTFAQLDPAHPASSVQLYVRDLAAGTTTLVSRAEGAGGAPADANVGDAVISPDGRHVVFLSTAGNLGAAASGTSHVYLRDVPGGHTTLVDRASGAGGAIANDGADEPSPSTDGRYVAFASRANNLDPDDPAGVLSDVYVRDTVAATTTLVSRRGGAGGVHASGSSDAAAISADGKVVAFTAEDETLAPEAGGWGGSTQVVARTLASGANVLVSRVPGGAPASADADEASVSGDGGVIAFESEATNLLPGVGGSLRPSVFVRLSSSGALSGPPSFGIADNLLGDHAFRPAISDDGQCLAFRGHGHNAVTGTAGDFDTSYVYVVSGQCPKPLPAVPPRARRLVRVPSPVLARASLTHRRFRVGRRFTARVAAVRGGPSAASAARRAARRRRRPSRAPVGTSFRFTLNTRSNVAIVIERPAQGRLVGRFCRRSTRRLRRHLRCVRFVRAGSLTRGGVAAGAVSVAFSGRIGRKALKPGAYRARLRASNASGVSRWVRLSFRVVR